MFKPEMHSPPLKRSVTAPNNLVLAATKAQTNFTRGNIPRHRSLSPNPQSRTRSNDSPRPLELLYHRSVLVGVPGSRPRAPSYQYPLETGSSSGSPAPETGIEVQNCGSSTHKLHLQNLANSFTSGLQPPMASTSEASSSSIGRVYLSTETSPRSSEVQHTPQNEADYDYLKIKIPQKPNDYSDTSSQSCLSFYVPPTFDTERMNVDSEHSGMSGLTLTDSEKCEAQEKISSYSTGEIHSRATTEDVLDLQFPVLTTLESISRVQSPLILRVDPGYFEGDFTIEDPDPSFHRALNSPVMGEPPEEVLVEQVGSFGVHHLRSDTLGQLPRITTIEALPISSPASSTEQGSPKRVIQLEQVGKAERVSTARPAGPSGEVTPSTVILPGEYFRRRHSGSHILSHGHRDFGLNLRIIDHVPSPSPRLVIEPRVSSDRPPNTPESPFAMISREKTKVKGRKQNSPSSLVTFLSIISPTETCGIPRTLRPKSPGRLNPSEVLPVTGLATTAICSEPAYGETHMLLTGMMNSSLHTPNVPLANSPWGLSKGSPCMESLRKVVEKDNLRILSRDN